MVCLIALSMYYVTVRYWWLPSNNSTTLLLSSLLFSLVPMSTGILWSLRHLPKSWWRRWSTMASGALARTRTRGWMEDTRMYLPGIYTWIRYGIWSIGNQVIIYFRLYSMIWMYGQILFPLAQPMFLEFLPMHVAPLCHMSQHAYTCRLYTYSDGFPIFWDAYM